jgi:hypothetical protein
MTKERIEALAQALSADGEQFKAMVEMSAEEVEEKLKSQGFDFTADEISEFGQLLAGSNAETGEVDESQLEMVSGGLSAVWRLLTPIGGPIRPWWYKRR